MSCDSGDIFKKINQISGTLFLLTRVPEFKSTSDNCAEDI